MKTQEKFENLANEIENIDNEFDVKKLEKLADETESELRDLVIDTVNRNADPSDVVVQSVNSKTKVMRKIGQKFFNLFKITFTVEFAGVVLVHFTIPKVDEFGNKINR